MCSNTYPFIYKNKTGPKPWHVSVSLFISCSSILDWLWSTPLFRETDFATATSKATVAAKNFPILIQSQLMFERSLFLKLIYCMHLDRLSHQSHIKNLKILI